jgi:hypothetical protein
MPIYTGVVLAVIAWLLEYRYLFNQCLSPLMLSVRISIRAMCTTLCDKVCQWLATDRWFSPGSPMSTTNNTWPSDRTEILLIGQYDKGFTNTFWTETLVMGPYGKGLNTLWAYDPFLVNVYDNGTTNTMKRHKVCQGSTSTLYMFVWWCSRHFQQYFSSIGRSGIIGGGNRWTRRKPPICRKSLTNFITNLLIRNELASSSWIYCQEDKCCHIRNLWT